MENQPPRGMSKAVKMYIYRRETPVVITIQRSYSLSKNKARVILP